MKAFKLTLHETNRKHIVTLRINYAFQKIARYIELENLWNRVYYCDVAWNK